MRRKSRRERFDESALRTRAEVRVLMRALLGAMPELASWLLSRSAQNQDTSGRPAVLVMKPAEYRQRDDRPFDRTVSGHRGLLAKPLVWACGIVVVDVSGDDALKVPTIEHKDMVEALATERAEKALADGVHIWRAHGRADDPDAGRARQHIESGPEAVVAIPNQEPWRCPERRGVAELLRHPRLGWGAGRCCEHDLACGELDEHEREDRTEEHIVGLQEVARPDFAGVVSGGRSTTAVLAAGPRARRAYTSEWCAC